MSVLKKTVLFGVRVIVSLGIIVVLLKFIPYQTLVDLFRNSIKSYIVIAFLVFFLTHILAIFRWRIIMFSLGIKVKIKEIAYSFFSGLFFNLFFPSLVAGDVFRSAALAHRNKQTFKIVSSVFMDRFSGATGLSLLLLLALIFRGTLILAIN